jgi:hypothetical protein
VFRNKGCFSLELENRITVVKGVGEKNSNITWLGSAGCLPWIGCLAGTLPWLGSNGWLPTSFRLISSRLIWLAAFPRLGLSGCLTWLCSSRLPGCLPLLGCQTACLGSAPLGPWLRWFGCVCLPTCLGSAACLSALLARLTACHSFLGSTFLDSRLCGWVGR